MRRTLQGFVLLTVAGIGFASSGCNLGYKRLPESGATLEGTVTYGKEKVAVALVIAQAGAESATGTIDEEGRYKIENVPLGEVSIGVNTAAGKGQMRGQMMAQSRTKNKGPMPKMIDVPAKYFEPSTSGIKTTINKGANTFDIVIPK